MTHQYKHIEYRGGDEVFVNTEERPDNYKFYSEKGLANAASKSEAEIQIWNKNTKSIPLGPGEKEKFGEMAFLILVNSGDRLNGHEYIKGVNIPADKVRLKVDCLEPCAGSCGNCDKMQLYAFLVEDKKEDGQDAWKEMKKTINLAIQNSRQDIFDNPSDRNYYKGKHDAYLVCLSWIEEYKPKSTSPPSS